MAHELTIHLLQRPWEMFTGFGVTLARLFNGMLPWSLLGLYYRRQDARDPYTTLLAIWGLGFAILFGLFMVLQRSRYLVPLTPPLAILCGHALSELQSDVGRRELPWRLFTSVLDLSFVGLALYCATLVAAGALVIKTSAPVVVGAAAGGTALVSLVVVRFLRRRAPQGIAWVLVAAFGLGAVADGRPVLLARRLSGEPGVHARQGAPPGRARSGGRGRGGPRPGRTRLGVAGRREELPPLRGRGRRGRSRPGCVAGGVSERLPPHAR